MNRMSKFLALGGVAGFGLVLALGLSHDGRAAGTVPSLAVSFSTADLDHAHSAFDGFRNRLDAAPRASETAGRTAAITGERADCARFAWPHIPAACQTSSKGEHLRPVRMVALDQTTR